MRRNPAGIPWWVIGGVAVVGSGGWVYSRLAARRKLAELLAASPLVAEAALSGVIAWSPQQKAAEAITFTNGIGAEKAFAEILDELRALMPPEAQLQIGQDAIRLVEDQLAEMGVPVEDVKAKVAEASSIASSVYQKLPDVPIVDTSAWLPSWLTGG